MTLEYEDGILIWPTHIKPSSVSLNILYPNYKSYTMTGRKHVRNLNFMKQSIEVAYPPMTEDNFRPFYAAMLALRGSYGLVWFDLTDTQGDKIIFNFSGNDTLIPYTNADYSTANGDLITSITLKNFPSNAVEPIPAGSVISGLGRNYGHVQHVIACTNANSSGVATITLAEPLAESVSANTAIEVNPTKVLCSLSEDIFKIDINTVKVYGFTINFDFDRTYD